MLKKLSSMRIKVYMPPYLKSNHIDENGFVEIEEGSRLIDLFKLLEVPVPPASVHLCRVNYEKVKLNRKLDYGDIVSFFSLITGG